MRPFTALLLAALSAPLAAQPSAEALAERWLADWRRAAASVTAIEVDERAERTLDGARRTTRVATDASVRYARGERADREVRSVRVDGREVDPERGPRLGRRLGRAFGPGGREIAAAVRLPGPLLARAGALSVEPDRLGGQAVWRVALRLPPPPRAPLDARADRGTAWFTRGESPRLLRLRVEGERPRGGRLTRDVRYVRVDGLDLPARAEVELTVRQRRRLRDYVVRLSAETTYSGHRVRR